MNSWGEWLEDFAYKPGWKFSESQEIAYKQTYILIEVEQPDSRNEGKTVKVSKLYPVDPFEYYQETHALAVMRECIRDLEMHEIDENIRLRGELVFDPH